jgi:hypothetical protein
MAIPYSFLLSKPYKATRPYMIPLHSFLLSKPYKARRPHMIPLHEFSSTISLFISGTMQPTIRDIQDYMMAHTDAMSEKANKSTYRFVLGPSIAGVGQPTDTESLKASQYMILVHSTDCVECTIDKQNSHATLTVILLPPRDMDENKCSPLNLLQRRRGGGTAAVEKEPRTGTEFPKNFCHLSKSKCPTLVGVG